jgi:hypothetical protein
MMDTKAELSLDKVIGAIPVLGVLCAVSYDTGFFWMLGQGYYALFSLTEHINFATQAIPAAIVTIGTLLTGVIFFANTASTDMLHKRAKRVGLAIVALLAIILLGDAIVTRSYGLLLLSIVVLFAAAVLLWSLTPSNMNFLLPIVGSALLLFLSFVTGAELADRHLKSPAVVHSLRLTDGNSKGGRIVRTGDRGVLFWDPSRRRLHLHKWESVQSIEGATEPVSGYPGRI